MFIFKSCETIKYKYKKVVSTQNEKAWDKSMSQATTL